MGSAKESTFTPRATAQSAQRQIQSSARVSSSSDLRRATKSLPMGMSWPSTVSGPSSCQMRSSPASSAMAPSIARTRGRSKFGPAGSWSAFW